MKRDYNKRASKPVLNCYDIYDHHTIFSSNEIVSYCIENNELGWEGTRFFAYRLLLCYYYSKLRACTKSKLVIQ